MSQEIPRIVPLSESQVDESIAASETSHEFYREVKVRSEFAMYCQWYKDTAKNNRQELEKMRGELNIFQWFRRKG